MRSSLLICCLLIVAACNTAGPNFHGLQATRVTVDGSTFDVRVNGRLAEALRVNPQYAPRFGPVAQRAGLAMQEVSGCTVSEVRGDQAVAVGLLDCGEGPPRGDRLAPGGLYECTAVEDWTSEALQTGYADYECEAVL